MAKAFQNVARVGRNIVKFGHTGWKQKKSRHFSRSKFAADGEYSFIIYFNVRVNRFRGENHQTSGRFTRPQDDNELQSNGSPVI